MTTAKKSRNKILNDPVYGFISLKHEIILELIDHPWFQRLRRITQLGLSHLVYPGALHNRFHHAIGAMFLMQNAIDVIRQKGHEISEDEELGALIAILLHDIGHGPYSHALEHSIVKNISHEEISTYMMNRLNEEFGGKLDLAIEIFNNNYHKKFLHQLVSSQLDMDRLDYLLRDSFYSGVTEGMVGSERIIKMLDVVDDELVVEEKGIYSIEKFIVARRLMYWQVYLHKTVLSAEYMLMYILKRARQLAKEEMELFCSPPLKLFLYNNFNKADFISENHVLESFARLDDNDIMSAIKVWQDHDDKVLSSLCKRILNRKLFKIRIQKESFDFKLIREYQERVITELELTEEEAKYFVISDKIENRAYSTGADSIKVLFKDGSLKDVTLASDHLNLSALAQPVEKYFLCFPEMK